MIGIQILSRKLQLLLSGRTASFVKAIIFLEISAGETIVI
jgi:hypothetical protein